MAENHHFISRVGQAIHALRDAMETHHLERLQGECRRYLKHPAYRSSLTDDARNDVVSAAVADSYPVLFNPAVPTAEAAHTLKTALDHHRDAWKGIHHRETSFQVEKHGKSLTIEPSVPSPETVITEKDYWTAVVELLEPVFHAAMHLLGKKDREVLTHRDNLDESSVLR